MMPTHRIVELASRHSVAPTNVLPLEERRERPDAYHWPEPPLHGSFHLRPAYLMGRDASSLPTSARASASRRRHANRAGDSSTSIGLPDWTAEATAA